MSTGPSTSFKYNPGILGDDALLRCFVVRHKCLDLILETLRENAGSASANRHLLVVGPRGIGKTMLVRRVAAEIRANPDYGAWFPIVFGEESYQISSAGEFWLEALGHLADSRNDRSLDATLADLREEYNDARLRERALSQLLDIADSQRQRLLLIVENLGMLCEQQITREAAWELRHTLTNEPRIMLLATATSRFDAVSQADQAWFELFGVHELKPLDREESYTLWRAVAHQQLKPGHVRAIRILTGGNPRLLTVLAGFATNRSFRELMEQLIHLIDDHTEYFKGHLDVLPAKERRVFVGLLEQWNPVTAAELSRTTRTGVNEVSSLLNRLVNRGAVEVVEGQPRRKLYQAAERLYNIYYLMRRRGAPSDRVRAAVSFMVMFYGGSKLAVTIADLAREACELPAGEIGDHFAAYAELARRTPSGIWARAFERTPPEFFAREDAPEFIRQLPRVRKAVANLKQAITAHQSKDWATAQRALREAIKNGADKPAVWNVLADVLIELGQPREAEAAFQKSIELAPSDAVTWRMLGRLLIDLRRFEEAEVTLRKSIALAPDDAVTWGILGSLLFDLRRFEEAEAALRMSIELAPGDAATWGILGILLIDLRRFEEAETAFRKSIELAPGNAVTWRMLGGSLVDLHRFEDAEEAYRKSIELTPGDVVTWRMLGGLLIDLRRFDEAETAFRTAIDLQPKDVCAWHYLGRVLNRRKRYTDAECACRKAVEIDPEHVAAWDDLGRTLIKLGRRDESEQAFLRGLDLDPKDHVLWFDLARLFKSTDRKDEARRAYLAAIELEPSDEGSWSEAGHFISEVGPPEEAERVWQRALRLHPTLAPCAVHLLEARQQLGVSRTVLIGEAGEWIERGSRSYQVLRSMSYFALRLKLIKILPIAESWAKEAVEKDPGWRSAHTLAVVYAARARWSEALQASRPVLDAAGRSKEARESATEFVVQAAAAGYAREALNALSISQGAQALEPLLIGLQIFLGEKPKVAKEINEIGQDVADRIRGTSQGTKAKKLAQIGGKHH